jgi:hypothetical protein
MASCQHQGTLQQWLAAVHSGVALRAFRRTNRRNLLTVCV